MVHVSPIIFEKGIFHREVLPDALTSKLTATFDKLIQRFPNFYETARDLVDKGQPMPADYYVGVRNMALLTLESTLHWGPGAKSVWKYQADAIFCNFSIIDYCNRRLEEKEEVINPT